VRQADCVILLDEIEKAHPTCSTCPAVLDDGRMTDGQGRTVDFQKTPWCDDLQPRLDT